MSNATAPREFNPQQMDIIEMGEGASCVDAGAGSGKTATITERVRRLIEQGVAPERILLMTFTVKAAMEMSERVHKAIGAQLPWATNFHRLCMKLLRTEPAFGLLRARVADEDRQKRIVRDCARQLHGIAKPEAKLVDSVLRESSVQRRHRMGYSSERHTWEAKKNPIVATLAADYEKALKDAGLIDFDRMIFDVVVGLRQDPELRKKISATWDFVIVDEAQDTNQAQFELLTLLVPPSGGRHKNIMLVGDMDQCIFGFAGAQVGNLHAFMEAYSAKRLPLELNYRSRAEILEVANTVIAQNKERMPKTLRPTLGKGGVVEAYNAPDTRVETTWVASQIQSAVVRGANPGDIAVLFRVGALSREVETALMLRKIPYRVVGALRFWERREVKDTLAFLRVYLGQQDMDAWDRALSAMPIGVGAKAMTRLQEFPSVEDGLIAVGGAKAQAWLSALLRARQGQQQVHKGLRSFLEGSGYLAEIRAKAAKPEEATQRLANIDEVLNALSLAQDPAAWLDEVALGLPSKEDKQSPHQVTLSTIHAAKGLEWRRVFLVGAVDGILPHERASGTTEELEEERRLLYVAITRAKDHLSISLPAIRMEQGALKAAIPSRFLKGLQIPRAS